MSFINRTSLQVGIELLVNATFTLYAFPIRVDYFEFIL